MKMRSTPRNGTHYLAPPTPYQIIERLGKKAIFWTRCRSFWVKKLCHLVKMMRNNETLLAMNKLMKYSFVWYQKLRKNTIKWEKSGNLSKNEGSDQL